MKDSKHVYYLKKKVLHTIKLYNMISPGDKVVVAVSGGPDSMTLLHILNDIKEDMRFSIHVAHLNHQLRGEESDEDAKYVEEQARSLGLPIIVESVDVLKNLEPGESIESGARRIRYDFFERVRQKFDANKIALGHNADDQVETILMNLLRGSGPQGLVGMLPKRDNRYIRPLIQVTRNEITEFLKEINITPRIDSSNQNTDYLRNRIRLHLLPILESKYNPNFRRILTQTAEIIRNEDEFLCKMTEEALQECFQNSGDKHFTINIPLFKQYHVAIRYRIIRSVIERLIDDLYGLTYAHIKSIDDMVQHGGTGSMIRIARHVKAEICYDRLMIYTERPQCKLDEVQFDYYIDVPGVTEIPELDMSVITEITEKFELFSHSDVSLDHEVLQHVFDYDVVDAPLHIRNKLPGDRFRPLGMANEKKLQDFFVDEKVPRWKRSSIPILACGDKIMWIIGYRIDDRFKISAQTKHFLVVTIKKCIQR